MTTDLRERIAAAITDLVEIQREPERPVNYEADSWSCLVGFARRDTMPKGSDGPMRDGVRDAFLDLTGKYPDFIFSGWGRHPSEAQSAVIENREPVYKETNFGKIANVVALLKDVLASMEQPEAKDAPLMHGPAVEDRLEEMVDAYCVGLGTDDPSFPALRDTMREGMRAVLALFYAEDADAARNAAYYRGERAAKMRSRNKYDHEFGALMTLAQSWRDRAKAAEGKLARREGRKHPSTPEAEGAREAAAYRLRHAVEKQLEANPNDRTFSLADVLRWMHVAGWEARRCEPDADLKAMFADDWGRKISDVVEFCKRGEDSDPDALADNSDEFTHGFAKGAAYVRRRILALASGVRSDNLRERIARLWGDWATNGWDDPADDLRDELHLSREEQHRALEYGKTLHDNERAAQDEVRSEPVSDA